ncbi:MAG: type IX secretion system membrane protein PorP/SprF [Bacteroidota bacterium]
MKKTILIFFAVALSLPLFGQQDPMYSQYYFNPLTVNPAYAGSRDALTMTGLIRRQWLGIQSAPVTQGFAVHTPDGSRRNGFGLQVINDKISYLGQTWLNAAYSYRVPIGEKYNLQLGLSATIYNWRINWNKAQLIDPTDDVPNFYGNNIWLPNAGFGAYFYGKKGFVGLSIPHLLVNSLDSNRPGISFDNQSATLASLKRHYFVMAGYVFEVTPDFWIKPSTLMKQVHGAPLEFDMNLNVYLFKKFGIGTSYRTGDGIVGMMEWTNWSHDPV